MLASLACRGWPMLKLTPEQQRLKPRSLTDIRLTPSQCDRQNQLYQTILKTGAVSPSKAALLAGTLLQDELLGLDARTPAQQQLALEFALFIAERQP